MPTKLRFTNIVAASQIGNSVRLQPFSGRPVAVNGPNPPYYLAQTDDGMAWKVDGAELLTTPMNGTCDVLWTPNAVEASARVPKHVQGLRTKAIRDAPCGDAELASLESLRELDGTGSLEKAAAAAETALKAAIAAKVRYEPWEAFLQAVWEECRNRHG